jgi:methylmalonyl-CoA/ethylmalonyl-CoA epimerase
MFNKIEHIGIAVKNADNSMTLFNALFQGEPYKTEVVESEHVKTIFYQIGPNKIELLESTSPDSAIAKFIEKKGEGMHHVAYEVDDISTEIPSSEINQWGIDRTLPGNQIATSLSQIRNIRGSHRD